MKRSSPLFVVLCVIGSSFTAQALPADKAQALQEYSEALVALAAEVKPAVVAIKTETEVTTAGRDQFRGTPFEDFFGKNPFFGQQPEQHQMRPGLGSGVIASEKGYIITNNHVITSGRETVVDRITVELLDKRSFEAEIVGRDPLTDLAILKIDADDLTALPIGDSDELRVGELVIAVGSPFGQLHSVSSGVVSALGRRSMKLAHYEEYIQTDAAINPGNSGGALVNSRGELVGINTAIVSRSGGDDGIGFAIPANLVRNVMDQLIDEGQVRRGLLGVRIQAVTNDLAKSMGLDKPRGVGVSYVYPESAADEAGLEPYDIVLALDGKGTNTEAELRNTIAHTPPGTKVKLLVWRDGEERMFTATLTALEDSELAQAPRQRHSERLGMRVQELTDEIAEQIGYEEERGVLVSGVERDSKAARKGLRRGDLIIEVNRQPVESIAEYERALEESGGTVLMLVVDGRQKFTKFITLKLPRE